VGADLRRIAVFERHTVDQVRRQIVVEPGEPGDWLLVPQGETLVRAIDSGARRILTFDPESGLLLAEQMGDTLVRYHYTALGLLDRVTYGGAGGTDTLLLQAEHGSNGHRSLRLRWADGAVATELTTDARQPGRRSFEVRWVFDRVGDPETVTLELATGNLLGKPSEVLTGLIGARGHRLAEALVRPSKAELIGSGAFTLLLAGDGKRVFVLPSALDDRARTVALAEKAIPPTAPPPSPTIRRAIDRHLEGKGREQLDRLRNYFLETALNSDRHRSFGGL
jgi:hypothetical protein